MNERLTKLTNTRITEAMKQLRARAIRQMLEIFGEAVDVLKKEVNLRVAFFIENEAVEDQEKEKFLDEIYGKQTELASKMKSRDERTQARTERTQNHPYQRNMQRGKNY